MILVLIAAPLIALGLPRPRSVSFPADIAATAAFALALWVWHAPGPYTATFESTAIYWLMHVTTFGAALLFWMAMFATPASRMARAIALTLATSLQMAFLGAVITFSNRPLYPPHAFTAQTWGLTALQDQQLGGSLMWAPAGLIFLVAIVGPLAHVLKRPAGPATKAAGLMSPVPSVLAAQREGGGPRG
jgi:putative membrane protein